MKEMFQPYRKYASFSGRASRKEYWLFMLFYYAVTIVLAYGAATEYATFFSAAASAFILISICPALGVQVRRLHDVGKSGWWYFICLIPFGNLYLLYLNVKAGDIGPNYYGYPDGYKKPAQDTVWQMNEVE